MPSADRLSPCGDTVLERVLLAIIEANTTLETAGYQQKRLDAAMTALLGPVTEAERRLEQALRFMARERQRDACEAEMAVFASCDSAIAPSLRSIRELAKFAAREVMGCATAIEVEASVSVLCNLHCQRRRVYDVELDHVRDALEAEAVRRILDQFAEWDVPKRL